MTFKPLLAEPAEDIEFPVFASVKIDGIRACMLSERLVSRRLKPIPNTYIRRTLEALPQLAHCDGELLTFTDGKMDDFNTIQSKVMSEAGKPEFSWYIFDHFEYPDWPYFKRQQSIPSAIPPYTKIVNQHPVTNQAQLDKLEAYALADGWEGLMVRSPQGFYKYGRSTARQGILLKVVRKQRAEGRIVGYEERMHNANPATIDERGYTERSSHKANKIGRDDLGALILDWNNIIFNVGTGFDDALRASLWQDRDTLIGQLITFEYRGTGPNGAPRFPAFIGFRHEDDT